MFFPPGPCSLSFVGLGRFWAKTDATRHSIVPLAMARANKVLLVMVSPEMGGETLALERRLLNNLLIQSLHPPQGVGPRLLFLSLSGENRTLTRSG
ncbi:MAG: hypothetical protein U0936_13425 [Planctomycetaceae bacterium]